MTIVLNIRFNAVIIKFMKTALRTSGSLQEAGGHVKLGGVDFPTEENT